MSPDAPAERRSWQALLAVASLQARLLLAPRFSVVLVLLALGPIGLAPILELILRGVKLDEATRRQWAMLYLYWAHVRFVLPLAALYVGASLWADEAESGTLVYLLTRPVPRSAALVAKWAVAWLFLATTVALSATASWAVFAAVEGVPFSTLWPILLVAGAGAAPYLAVFTLCGVLTGRGLILGLVYLGASDGVLWLVAFVARKLTISHYTASALGRLGAFHEMPAPLLTSLGDPAGPWEAWLALAGIAAGAVGAAAALVSRREYAPTRTT